jgi:transaldolase / glucose-6-phosphate isomerase
MIQGGRIKEREVRRASPSVEILVNPLLQRIATLGPYRTLVNASLELLASKRILERVWAHDHTVWGPDAEDIRNRLDWLDAPEKMFRDLSWLNELAHEVRAAGFRNVLLLGMGGSSLAADVFAKVFGRQDGFPELQVLDTIHPDVVAAAVTSQTLDLQKTLVIVSSKSGRTIETISLMKYFYGSIVETVGKERCRSFRCDYGPRQ